MYTTMTNEQLYAAQTTLYVEMKACKGRKRAIDAELDRRAAEQEAAQALAKLSPEGRARLAQQIGATGVATQEAVGTPGAR